MIVESPLAFGLQSKFIHNYNIHNIHIIMSKFSIGEDFRNKRLHGFNKQPEYHCIDIIN